MSLGQLQGVSALLGGQTVLAHVDLTLRPGELVAVCGPNGAGKSSLIRAALGLLPLTAGTAFLGGTPVRDLSPRQRAARAAYLPQERRIAWNMPAVEIAALGTPFLSGDEARDKALAGLAAVDADHLAHRGVAEMSGGERARVLLARALISDAPVLFADEPIAGLDPDAQLLVLEQLRLRARGDRSVLVSLHDLSLAARYADRVVVMDRGRVVADDRPLVALASAVLAATFGVRGEWVTTDSGHLLDLYRKISA